MLKNPGFAFLTIMLFTPMLAIAQQQGPGGQRQGPGQGPGGGGFDPAQMQQMQLENIRQELAVNEEEWSVLEPKVQALMTAQREAGANRGRGNRGGSNGGNNNGGGNNNNASAETAVARAMTDLRDALDREGATAAQITTRVTALREARTKAVANLATAQKTLKELLTARQEALMVSMGYLE